MAIAADTRFGPYEVQSILGVGGMGEVYRARDHRLGRDVAIKVLPAAWTIDPDRRARCDREARALASLNHPNIAAIYGLEESTAAEGPAIQALVLELVEGEALDDICARGRLSVPDALEIARQIADALDAAHEKSIVHRDLKPANVKVTSDGLVKVLDFGLAKVGDDGRDMTMAGSTQAGVILGTPAYMSPEQARGKPFDKRVDIWAFGCVLFELLVGEMPFRRETPHRDASRDHRGGTGLVTAAPFDAGIPPPAAPPLSGERSEAPPSRHRRRPIRAGRTRRRRGRIGGSRCQTGVPTGRP
jgi:serine/threonine protein kinase